MMSRKWSRERDAVIRHWHTVSSSDCCVARHQSAPRRDMGTCSAAQHKYSTAIRFGDAPGKHEWANGQPGHDTWHPTASPRSADDPLTATGGLA
jgi:hypothetical protein